MYGEGGNEDTLPDANRHEQEDGSIIAVAATGTINLWGVLERLNNIILPVFQCNNLFIILPCQKLLWLLQT